MPSGLLQPSIAVLLPLIVFLLNVPAQERGARSVELESPLGGSVKKLTRQRVVRLVVLLVLILLAVVYLVYRIR